MVQWCVASALFLVLSLCQEVPGGEGGGGGGWRLQRNGGSVACMRLNATGACQHGA